MKTKAIIFDKDGTLMDFDSFWVTITRVSLIEILNDLQRGDIDVEELLCVLGVENGITDITSVFAYGTFTQVGEVIHSFLADKGCHCSLDGLVDQIVRHFHANTAKGIIAPACPDIAGLMARLRAMDIKLAVATTDDPHTTGLCLRTLGIEDCFEMVYTDDGVWPPKPDPCCIHDLCRRLDLTPDQVAMVGDSINDMRFAHNGGIRAIGVAKSPKNRQALLCHADAVIPDISHILQVIP